MEESGKGRIKDYKNFGKDPEECRRRRQDITVQLRKHKKEDTVLKKRNINLEHAAGGVGGGDSSSTGAGDAEDDLRNRQATIEELVANTQSLDPTIKLNAVQATR